MKKFNRVVIKISGEALAGEKKTGFDFDLISTVCEVLKKASEQGTQIGIVIGGGNFWRGVKDGAGKVERVNADRMGMLATCMNCIAVCDVLRQLGAKARVMTAVDIMGVGERYDTRRAIEYLDDRPLRRRQRRALLLHRYRGRSARGRDPRRRHPPCQEHRRRLLRRSEKGPDGGQIRRDQL